MYEWLKSIFAWLQAHPRHSALIVLGGLLSIFVVQNTASIDLQFLFWTFPSRRIVVIAVSLFAGLLVGWLYGYEAGRKDGAAARSEWSKEKPRDGADQGDSSSS